MAEFIIHGPGFFSRVVEAETLSIARRLAIRRAFKAGHLEPEALRECWAEPWTWDRAYDLNLLPYEGVPQWVENFIDRSWL